jgi:hypothetical protein
MPIPLPPADIPKYTRYPKNDQRFYCYTHLKGHENDHSLCASCLVDVAECPIIDALSRVPDFIDTTQVLWECPSYQADGSVPVTSYTRNEMLVWVIDQLQGLENDHCLCYDPCTVRESCKIFPKVETAQADYGIILPIWACSKFIPIGGD